MARKIWLVPEIPVEEYGVSGLKTGDGTARRPSHCLSRGINHFIMSVDSETVRKIASLARIAMTDEQIGALVPEFNNILTWIEQLGEVDTSAVEPMTAVIPNSLRLRDDVISDGSKREDVLANAPAAEHGFFGVPKVIE